MVMPVAMVTDMTNLGPKMFCSISTGVSIAYDALERLVGVLTGDSYSQNPLCIGGVKQRKVAGLKR